MKPNGHRLEEPPAHRAGTSTRPIKVDLVTVLGTREKKHAPAPRTSAGVGTDDEDQGK